MLDTRLEPSGAYAATIDLNLPALPKQRIPSGGGRRDRTDDLMLAKHALSQLSYAPVPEDECSVLTELGSDGGPGKT